ncbi:hypothetical protein DL96DRAFT_1712209 [Flagelloscypha sp. PMI_526]|nr:hypothetical protein DL96DRAFT_1712209 [Flagelloscypha sp. PMI_526]
MASPSSGSIDAVIKSNPDISGIGIRVSFYLQVICLSGLSVRSSSAVESGNALSSLVVTNLAYAVTTIALGMNPKPSITLYDALVVIYLLTLSWLTIFISLPHYTRFKRSQSALKNLAIVQSYLCFITGFAILGNASTFGDSQSDCNKRIKAVIFGSFSLGCCFWIIEGKRLERKAKKTIQACWGTVLVGMSIKHGNDKDIDDLDELDGEAVEAEQLPSTTRQPGVAGSDSTISSRQRRRADSTSKSSKPPPKKFDGTVLVQLVFLLVIAGIGITNTELVIRYNVTTEDNNGSESWTFGQILPLFLTVLPIWSLVNSFKTHKLGAKRRRRSKKRSRSKAKRRYSDRTMIETGPLHGSAA